MGYTMTAMAKLASLSCLALACHGFRSLNTKSIHTELLQVESSVARPLGETMRSPARALLKSLQTQPTSEAVRAMQAWASEIVPKKLGPANIDWMNNRNPSNE